MRISFNLITCAGVAAALILVSGCDRGSKPKTDEARGFSASHLAERRPRRVVTLVPSLAELAAHFAGDDLDRIVGVSDFTDYPLALKARVEEGGGVTVVGPYHRFNVEKVVALRPDLVLATTDGNSKDQVEQLQSLGIPVTVVRTSDLSGVYESIRQVGAAMGAKEQGIQLARQLESGVEAVQRRAAARKRKPKVFLQLGDDPIITVGQKTFIQDSLEAVGALNSFADLQGAYPRPSREEVLRRDPDVIAVLALDERIAPFEKMAARWRSYPRLKAVREKRVSVLRADELLRPTLRFLDGLARLEGVVHAE